nr:translation initiation factor IF-2 N-terminal domain-containing protein [Pyrinomonadaceae bacterium]
MTVLQSKIRIYDLAKELKLESKRLIEEVRREGVDVSVPSNTISKELAEKIRNKYFPKKEAATQRVVRVVKKTARSAEAGEADDIHLSIPPPVAADPLEYSAAATATAETAPLLADDADESGGNKSIRLLKKLPPAARAEYPTTAVAEATSATHATEQLSPQADDYAVVATEQIHVAADNSSSMGDQAAAPAAEMSVQHSAPAVAQGNGTQQAMPAPPEIRAPETGGAPLPGQSRQVKQLRLTKEAISSGLRHGERAPAPIPTAAAPTPPTPRERDRRGAAAGPPA